MNDVTKYTIKKMKSKNVYIKAGLFFFITYVFTGIFFLSQNFFEIPWEIIQLAMFGPTIGAIIMVILQKDKIGIFFKEIFQLKGDLMCYLSLIIPIVLIGLLSNYSKEYLQLETLFKYTSVISLVIFIATNILAIVGEEIGWRGYLLPTLQTKFNPLVSGLIVGILWEIWHLPTKVGLGMTMLMLHAIFIISLSVIITVYYNKSSKSIIPAILMHSSVNLTGYLFLVCIIDIRVYVLFASGFGLWALILTFLNWKNLMDRSKIIIQ